MAFSSREYLNICSFKHIQVKKVMSTQREALCDLRVKLFWPPVLKSLCCLNRLCVLSP